MRNPSRRSGAFAPPLIGLAVLFVSSFLIYSQVANAASPPQGNQGAGFLGQWCAQGDPNKQTSITSNGGVFFNLTNEQGDTSPGLPAQPLQLSLQRIQLGTGNADQFGCFGAPSVRHFRPKCRSMRPG